MRIGGLQKNTAIDFPGLIAAIVFTRGCNFTCPYCHNPELARPFFVVPDGRDENPPVTREDVLSFLKKRRNLLDGVVISGGEPTLQPDLMELCRDFKNLGYAVKLDSNGSRPDVIKNLAEAGLMDYIALDLKSDPAAYPPEISPKPLGGAILESVGIIKKSGLAHEFRVTAAAPFVSRANMAAIAEAARGEAPLFIQRFRAGETLDPAFPGAWPQPDLSALEELRRLALPFTPNCNIR